MSKPLRSGTLSPPPRSVFSIFVQALVPLSKRFSKSMNMQSMNINLGALPVHSWIRDEPAHVRTGLVTGVFISILFCTRFDRRRHRSIIGSDIRFTVANRTRVNICVYICVYIAKIDNFILALVQSGMLHWFFLFFSNKENLSYVLTNDK